MHLIRKFHYNQAKNLGEKLLYKKQQQNTITKKNLKICHQMAQVCETFCQKFKL